MGAAARRECRRAAGGARVAARASGRVDARQVATASLEARAQRRWQEMRDRGESHTLLEIEEDLRRRDERDKNRAAAPLVVPDDAYVLDTTALDKDASIAAAIDAVLEATGQKPCP